MLATGWRIGQGERELYEMTVSRPGCRRGGARYHVAMVDFAVDDTNLANQRYFWVLVFS